MVSHKRFRKTGLIVSAFLLSLVVAACGSGTATPSRPPTSVPTTPPTATAAIEAPTATQTVDSAAAADATDDGGDEFYGQTVQVSPLSAAPGAGKVILNIHLPDGYAFNDQAPFTLHVFDNDVTTVKPADNDLKIVLPKMPVSLPVTWREGKADLMLETHVYYCEAVNENLCFPVQLRLVAPLTVSKSAGQTDVTFDYALTPPKALNSN